MKNNIFTSIFGKWRKTPDEEIPSMSAPPSPTPVPPIVTATPSIFMGKVTTGAITGVAPTISGIAGFGGASGSGPSASWFSVAAQPPPPYVFSTSPLDSNLLTIYSASGKELVRLNKDGSVSWAQEVDVNEASRQFERMLNISLENKIGISFALKCKIRDQVFDEVIRFAKEKGSLTADDLTFMLESSKIIEKLKGLNE